MRNGRNNDEMRAGPSLRHALGLPAKLPRESLCGDVSNKKCVESVKRVKSPFAMREVAFATPYPILSTAWFRGRSFAGFKGAAGGKCGSEAP
jgi:hypothetical protein